MNKHTDQAIRNTHPAVVKVVYNDPIEAYDRDENPVAIDMAAAEAEIAALEAAEAKLAYRELRRVSYPPIGDLAEAIVKQPTDGGAALGAYRAACLAVQANYPKPE